MNIKKSGLLALIIFAFSFMGLANPVPSSDEIDVKTEVHKAIVFLNGAQVHRKIKMNLKAGQNRLVFRELSPYINAGSIQVKMGGKIQLLDASHRLFYPQPEEKKLPAGINLQIEGLIEKLDILGFDMQLNRAELEGLKKEKKILWDNKLMNGSTGSDSLPILQQSLLFFKEYIGQLDVRVNENRKKDYVFQKKKVALTTELSELKTYKAQFERAATTKTENQVLVDCQAEIGGYATVEISYFVNNAGWRPTYDLRVNGIDQPMEFTYKAEVFQNTGINWGNVDLTVSTTDPFSGKLLPIFNPVYVRLGNPYQIQGAYGHNAKNARAKDNNAMQFRSTNEVRMENDEVTSMSDMGVRPAAIADVAIKPIHVEFNSRYKHDVPSDGRHHTVLLKDYEVDALYEHKTLPRNVSKAYLIAKVVDWENLNLLPGKANLFLEDTYVGQTTINPNIGIDTLQIDMGTDESVFVSRKKLACETSKNLLGTRKTKIYTYEIKVRNNKNALVNISVVDQIPLSSNEEIEIELSEAKKAKFDTKTGRLEWNVDLEPKEEVTLVFKYEVEFPDDKVLAGL